MRLRQLYRRTVREMGEFRVTATQVGYRVALVSRVRHHLDFDGVDRSRLEHIEGRLADLESRLWDQTVIVVAHEERREQDSAGQWARAAELDARIFDMSERMRRLQNRTEVRLADGDRVHARDQFVQRIGPVTEWVRHVTLTTAPRISVIMATRNRAELLVRAVESVRSQDYPHWELVIVDDGSTDDTAAVVEGLAGADERIVALHHSHGGAYRARNAGLDVASGDIVCYLDDDNTMEPLWLKGIAWAFERQPRLDVLYGARVVDGDVDDTHVVLPYLHFEPFNRRNLETYNLIDLNVLVHRRELPEARFDESLEACGDWDLALRLSENRTPFALPVVGSIYSVGAPNRISGTDAAQRANARMQARMHRLAPLRVLVYAAQSPAAVAADVEGALVALGPAETTLAWCVEPLTPSPSDPSEADYNDLYTGAALFEPDAIVVVGATLAADRLDGLTDLGVPFALVNEPTDDSKGHTWRVKAHPLCVGTWPATPLPADAPSSNGGRPRRDASGGDGTLQRFAQRITEAAHQRRALRRSAR
jgi:hypothetical protein